MGVIREPQRVSFWAFGTRSTDVALEIARQAGLGPELELIRTNVPPLRDASVLIRTRDRSQELIVARVIMERVNPRQKVFCAKYEVSLGPGFDPELVRRVGRELHDKYMNSPKGLMSFYWLY